MPPTGLGQGCRLENQPHDWRLLGKRTLIEDLGLEALRLPFGPDHESEGDGVFRGDNDLTTGQDDVVIVLDHATQPDPVDVGPLPGEEARVCHSDQFAPERVTTATTPTRLSPLSEEGGGELLSIVGG